MAKKTSKKARKPVENGLKTFSIHSMDEAAQPSMAALIAEEAAQPSFGFAAAGGVASVNPETAARRYLDQALDSAAVPKFTAPAADQVPSEFKSLGTETIPLTGTTVVKFRQNFSKIPVYGSLVTVELDEFEQVARHQLRARHASIGEPRREDFAC